MTNAQRSTPTSYADIGSSSNVKLRHLPTENIHDSILMFTQIYSSSKNCGSQKNVANGIMVCIMATLNYAISRLSFPVVANFEWTLDSTLFILFIHHNL